MMMIRLWLSSVCGLLRFLSHVQFPSPSVSSQVHYSHFVLVGKEKWPRYENLTEVSLLWAVRLISRYSSKGERGLTLISWPVSTASSQAWPHTSKTFKTIIGKKDGVSSSWAEHLIFITPRLCGYERPQPALCGPTLFSLSAVRRLHGTKRRKRNGWKEEMIRVQRMQQTEGNPKIHNLHSKQWPCTWIQHHTQDNRIKTRRTKETSQITFQTEDELTRCTEA